MHRPLAALLTLAAAGLSASNPAAAHAQKAFEGVVTMRMTDPGSGKSSEMQYSARGRKIRLDVVSEQGTMGVIMDVETSKATMLVPRAQSYMEMDVPSSAEAEARAKVTRTGRKDRVAGRECEIITVVDERKNESEICGATDMGRFVMAGRGAETPAWARGMENFFPLRVSTKAGAVMEVTKIEPRSLDPSLFAVPAGWRSMGSMARPK